MILKKKYLLQSEVEPPKTFMNEKKHQSTPRQK